ncbi:Clp protease N-terminal domain-containing protein [Paractinoplanes rhizophilus]|uniref:Clp protease N-terminal domain-containing protein n=1 Tax=Paractinoplanes rhizophilus TaxID=1416877 RepID=A0ABW2HVI2_9ACTN
MFEKFTSQARQVVVLAQEEARLLQHNYIGTEHLLLGLLDQGDVAAAAGLSADQVRARVEEAVGRGQREASGHIPFTPPAKKTLEQAMLEAKEIGDGTIGVEHLLLGLLRQTDSAAVRVVTGLGADPGEIRRRVLAAPPAGSAGPSPVTHVTAMTSSMPAPGPLRAFARAVPVLERYARVVDPRPVAGRDAEIERLRQVISRRTRNSAVLVGSPGAGRRAVAEGFASSSGAKVYAVDFALVAVGADTRAEAEWRITALLAALRDAVVLTEELAPFEGLPGDHGPLLAVFVRAALERQELQLITTSSPDAYEKLDPRLSHLLQKVAVSTPSAPAAAEMLAAVRPRYEAHHDVRIDDAALPLCATLAAEHLGTLPASATHLLDEACAGAAGTDRVVAEADVRAALKRLRS